VSDPVTAYLDWLERLSGDNLTVMLAVALATALLVVGSIVVAALLVASAA
jgi:hypothetical protein